MLKWGNKEDNGPPHSSSASNNEHSFQEKILSSLKNFENIPEIMHSHTWSIANLEIQIGQLATMMGNREEGKLPSRTIENPKGWTHEQTKVVMVLKQGWM